MKTRDTDPIKTIMQITGHFEYVYKDKYFSNSYEWTTTTKKIVYFFHRYFINIVLYLYDEMWRYGYGTIFFFLFVCSVACYWISTWSPEQMHFVVDGLVLFVEPSHVDIVRAAHSC